MSAFKVFFFSILLTLSLVVFTPALAQSSTPSANLKYPVVTSTAPVAQISTDNLVIQLVHTLSCLTEGKPIDGTPCFENIGNQIGSAVINKIPGQPAAQTDIGAIGMTQLLMLGMYTNQPINSQEYLADLGQSLNVVKPAHAEVYGTGSQVVRPILELWKITRNISYMAMTLIFVVVGFMIMFNRKLNPQTVISVQNALPGLIIGLILITFSYFLASLIIDTSFVATNLVGTILEGDGNNGVIPRGQTAVILESENVLTIFNSFVSNTWNVHDSIINSSRRTLTFIHQGVVAGIVEAVLRFVGCQWGWEAGGRVLPWGQTLGGTGLGNTISVIGSGVACFGIGQFLVDQRGLILGLILYLVLVVALLVAMFKLFYSLVATYLSIVVLTIVGPFYFLIGSLPGKGNVAGEWIKSMFGNILVFPAVFLVFIFAAYLGSLPDQQLTGGTLGSRNVFGHINGAGNFDTNFTMPLFGGFPVDLIRLLLAYGVLLALPVIPEQVRKALGVKGLEAIAQAAAGNFNTGLGGANNIRGFTQGAFRNLYNRPAVSDRVNRIRNWTPGGGIRPMRWLPESET